VSSTSQLTDFSDLYTDLQNRVRVTTGVTATETQAKRYTNIALHDMHLGTDYRFPWAERSARLVTQPQYTTGTVSITQGSTTLTGSSTTWNTNNAFGVKNMRAGGKIRIGGSMVPYVIDTVSGDTSATLTSRFTEADVTATTYVYYEDEYALASDFLRPVDLQQFSDQVSIALIGRTEFRRVFPSNSVPGRPRSATLIDAAPSGNTTPVRRVRFAPPPSTALTIPYAYITANLAVSALGVAQANLSAATDEPIVPLRYRHAILFHALYHWYRDKKDDARTDAAKAEYTDMMIRMTSDVDIGASRPRIRPRVGPYARAARRPWSGAGAKRFDINGRFDRMED
jgi:hypothetical protein